MLQVNFSHDSMVKRHGCLGLRCKGPFSLDLPSSILRIIHKQPFGILGLQFRESSHTVFTYPCLLASIATWLKRLGTCVHSVCRALRPTRESCLREK